MLQTSDRPADRLDRIFFRWIFPALLAGVFVTYATFRQRYIGASDWYGYYQQGELLKSGRVSLSTELPSAEYPALVPFGYFVERGRAIPQYTPGFPFLLAAGSLLGLTFFVTPFVGLGSCVLMFLLIRDLTDRWIAAVFTLVWAFFPIVVFGSTTMMSDLVAATGLLGAYYAYRRGQVLLSAWVLGFSFCVRPTNVLFLVPFLLPLLRDRRLIRYGLYLFGPVLLYGLYNHALYGSPWRTGYADIRMDLASEVFPQHFGFYLKQTLWQCSPLIIALALWGLRPWSWEKLFYVLWFGIFLFFYCFWRSGGDRWWWTRFLLPGYPPIFLLAAAGFGRLRDGLRAGGHAPGRLDWRVILLFSPIALLPVWETVFGWRQHDLWKLNKGHDYYEVTQRVAALVPPGSLVGSVEFAGSFRLYTQLTPFVSVYDSALPLITEGLRRQRHVYLVVESWNLKDRVILEALARFSAEKIHEIPLWGGLPLYELHSPRPAPLAPTAAPGR
ncbi:MAG: hypothetical protein EXS39_00215 [Opitutaceae bacterium]|nr:hypothetical protein [Opitutaceae bacterium]